MLGREAAGPGTYEEQLLHHLVSAEPATDFFVWCSREGRDRLPHAPNLTARTWWPRLRMPTVAASMPWDCLRRQIDVVHATFVPPIAVAKPVVFTVHDLSPVTHPEFYKPELRARLRYLIERGIRRADVVLCISHTTRRHVIEHYGVRDDRLAVAYHGVDARFNPGDPAAARRAVASRLGIDTDFVLCLGKIESRKNTARLIEAYGAFKQASGSSLKLVLAGKRHWGMEHIDDLVIRHKLHGEVIETGYVDDDLVPDLYRAAAFVILPSLWEGFGLPLIEAMACGAPVATSDAACLPEIANGAALEFNPLDIDAITAALTRLDRDIAERERLRALGYKRAAQFSWERCATATLAAYRQALA